MVVHSKSHICKNLSYGRKKRKKDKNFKCGFGECRRKQIRVFENELELGATTNQPTTEKEEIGRAHV